MGSFEQKYCLNSILLDEQPHIFSGSVEYITPALVTAKFLGIQIAYCSLLRDHNHMKSFFHLVQPSISGDIVEYCITGLLLMVL